jgi:DNA-binding response OmpR family regulator
MVAQPWPILLVEHYLPLARPLVRGLEEEGIVTHLARDDAEAATLARTTLYAALVVDWNIPRHGGAALVRAWRRDGLAVPVLLLMSVASEANLRQGRAAGADAFLPLPFPFADLVGRLRGWIASGPTRLAEPRPKDHSLSKPVNEGK